MADTNRVSTLTVRGKEEGLDAVANKLEGVAGSARKAEAAADAFAKTTDQSVRRLGNIDRDLDRTRKSLTGFAPAFGSFEKGMQTAERALEAGKLDLQEYGRTVAELQTRLQKQVVPNLKLGVDQSGTAAVLAGLTKLDVAGRKAFIDLAQAAEAAEKAAFAQARANEAAAAQVARIKAQIEPYAAAQSKLNDELREYAALADAGHLSSMDLAKATDLANQRFRETTKHLQGANDNIKLTGGQVQNLGYQLNDIATSLASGASPFQVLAQQGGQVLQALQDGPGGVLGSLKAIGVAALGLLTPVNLLVAGLTAAAGAGLYFALRTTEKIKPLNEAMDAHRKSVEAVAGSYGVALKSATDYARASSSVAALSARRSRAELLTSARSSLSNGLVDQDIMTRTRAGMVPTEEFRPFQTALNALRESMRKGVPDAKAFMDAVARIAELNPTNDALQKAAGKLLDVAEAARQAQELLGGLGVAFARAKSDADKFNQFATDLGGFIPDRRTDGQRIEQTFQDMMRLAKSEADVTRAQDMRRLSLDALSKKDELRRAGYELDIREINARTAAERAAIAAERQRLAVAEENISQAEKDRLVQEARTLSLAQSNHDFAEAMRQRTEAGRAQVDAAQFELTLVGKSAEESARLRAEYDMLTAAKQAAREAGTVVDPAEIDQIKAQAAAIGEATAALEKLNYQRDLVFRLQQAGRSDQDQRIADQLRSSGIDFDSQEGQARAQQLRYVESVEKTSKALKDMRDAGKDAFADLIDAIGQGDNAFDAIISSFARFGQQLSSAGFDRLFGGLFGTANPTGSSAGIGSAASIATKLATVGASLGHSGGVGSDYASLQPTSTVRSASASAALASSPAIAIWRFFESKGLSKVAISGIMGNAFGESAYNPRAVGDNGNALGVFQWNDRSQALKDFAGGDWQDLGKQLDFAWHELSTTEKGTLDRLKQATTVSEATQAFLGFERPQGYSASDPTRSHNYSGRLSAAQSAFGKYADDKPMTQAVSDGMVDYSRKAASGAIPLPTARPTTSEGGIGINPGQIDKLSGGMQALGAGIGIFSQGYQSQSPIGGALSGVMGGFQAGSTLGPLLGMAAGAGPIGAAIGGIVGLVGGLFGKSKAKKEAQKQKWAQAEEAWQQNLPQFRQFEDTVTRTERGPLSSKIKEMQETLKQFDDLAKKGKGDRNNDQIRRVRAELADYVAFLSDNFIRDLPTVIGDLGKGQGIDTAFTKARDNVMQTADSYRGFLKDITDAYAIPVDQKAKILSDFETAKAAAAEQKKKIEEIRMDGKGNPYRATKWETIKKDDPAALAAATATRDDALAAFDAKYGDAIQRMNEQLEAARNAAVDGLLKIVSGDMPEQSDIEKAIQESAGAASGLRTALVDLGKTAEETGALIDQALSKRMDSLRKDFTTGLQDKIDDLDGKGYLASVRDLIKSRDGLLKDADLLNVDTSLVDTFFTKSAQSLVDGAELTGDAFNDLVKLFPELTGKVKAFGEVVSSQTVQEGLKAFLSDRLAEATQKRSEAESDLLSVYNESKDRLEGFKDSIADFLKNIRLSDQSPLSQKDQFLEAQKTFRDLQAKALAGDKDAQDELVSASQSYLDEARAYYKSSDSYFASFNEVEGVLKSADVKATSQLDLMKSQVGSLVDISDTTKSIDEAIKALTDAIKAQKDLQDKVDGGRSFGLNPERNRLIDAGVKQLGLNYTGNYGLTNGVDQFLKWRSALPADQRAAVEAVINQYIGLNKQMGGLIPGFAAGGIIGNGLWNKDSVLARYQNGGSVALAGGEMVISAPKVTPRTYPVLDAINRTGMVPANGDGGVSRAEFAELSRKIDRLTAVVAAGAQMTTDEVRRGNGIAQEGVDAQRKQNSRAA